MAHELQQAGWRHARALVGGWQAWLDAGLPVVAREEQVDLSVEG